MNEPPKNRWTRSLSNRRSILFLFLAVAGTTFCGILILGAVPGQTGRWLDRFAIAFFVAVGIGMVAVLGYLFLRWFCVWRNLRRLLFVLACLATLLALLITEENWRGRRAWENHQQMMTNRGEKFRLQDLAPPPVPDDRNFALTPLLKPIFDFSYNPQGGAVWRDTNAYARIANLRADLGLGSCTNQPSNGDLTKGTFTDLQSWQAFYRGNTNYPQPARPGAPGADILTALGKFDGEIKELQEAAISRPEARFPIQYDTDPLVMILLPHLAQMRGIMPLFNLRARAELDLGRTDDALTDLKVALRLGDALKDEPILISHLVRLAILNINLQTVREGLVRHAWTDAQLSEMDQYLASLNLLAEWKHTMHGERIFSTSSVDYMRRMGIVNPETFRSGPWWVRKTMSVALGGLYYQNMLTLSEMNEEYILPAVDENARRVFPEKCAAAEKEFDRIHAHPIRHPGSILATMFLPAIPKSSSRTARMQSGVDEARIAIALERYRLTNNHLPDSLDQLVPQFIDKIPHDVMDGQPLRYRKTGDDTFILYSIGWNLKDDDGVIGRKPEGKGIDPLSGDWVWFSTTNVFKLE